MQLTDVIRKQGAQRHDNHVKLTLSQERQSAITLYFSKDLKQNDEGL